MSKNVKKMDITLQRLKERFPHLRFKARQKTTKTNAKGWGVHLKRQETETTFEPIERETDEGC